MEYKMYGPTRQLFGAGVLNRLHRQKFPGNNALLVISSGTSLKSSGTLERIETQLDQAGIGYILFDQVQSNPLKSTVMEGAALARREHCDFVLAAGGGSVMDAGKVIAQMAVNPGDAWDYVFGGTGGRKKAPHRALPVVCITTTAGTGSEVDQWAVITNEETKEKIGCGGTDDLFPVLAVIDPELMLTVPPQFTAYQGFDAIFHSTECCIARPANFMSNMYALEALRHLSLWLPAAVRDGSNIHAREHVAFGNTLSGTVMTLSSCTSEHAIEHAMSAFHPDLPHGAGLILLSVPYYQFLLDNHACDEKFLHMAHRMGTPMAQHPEDFITCLKRIQKNCGVDDLAMSDFGIQKKELPDIVANARETMGALFQADPCDLSDEHWLQILQTAWK